MTQVNVTSANAAQIALAQSRSQATRAEPTTATAPEELARLSQRTAQFITALSNSKSIPTQSKEAMIDISTLVDTFVKNPAARNKFYRDLAGIGIFIGKEAKGQEFPYYPTLTGLRYYDTMRSKLQQEPANLADVVQLINTRLTGLAQESGAESVEAALAEVAANQETRAQIADFVRLDEQVSGTETSEAPQTKQVDTSA